jgi:MoaA/NifB/PqqE/SkfB family radical SAM enzyme
MDLSKPISVVRSISSKDSKFSELRKDAKFFPMMIVISTVYPCNFGCPNCPYSEGNSDLRSVYKSSGGDYLPQELWNKMAKEAGPHQTWLRCTGGGEPMMHPKMVEMITYAKNQGCRVWLNTNGSLFGPNDSQRRKLSELIESNIDIIEFSMDAGESDTYAIVRPPLKGKNGDPKKRWEDQVSNIKEALQLRLKYKSTTRIVVSIIRQKAIEGKLEEAISFWKDTVGVDEVITRKFLSWDDNTNINLENSVDKNLYQININSEKQDPCVWPFERLNVDTLGRVALCGQDISFRTSHLFPNLNDASISEVWLGETFTNYRKKHLEGNGASLFPCTGCSAWKAGVRDWEYGWIQVLDKSADNVREVFKKDLGTEVQVYTPDK